jgi:hypothetical protein
MPSRDWFLVPFPLKQLFPPHPLGILPVVDLQPGCDWQVGINFSLCHYTFEIALADKMEQLLTYALNVITVQQPFTVRWDQATQPMLTVCQGQVTQVLAIAEQQIKGVVARLTSAKQQVCELRSARLIQANDFPIEHGILGTTLQRKSKIQSWEGLELISVAGDQLAMAVFDVCQGAKAVPLDLKEPVRMGKGPWRTANWHGLKIRQHLSNMIRVQGVLPLRRFRLVLPATE